ncbi:acyltransferase [Lelliottia amnigena]|uniref:acyltransferase family protein n=1 Tax=Lelliottia amnigena TaxID=61646 RepID=UPI001F3D9C1D|nr:acyltransferase family protein [Lelliottia amnigena]UJD93737.1 acyltransferase [Lelliottia amnigena]
MNFRYDINGLRAFAVIAVVLFHFNPSWLPGGFAGVDVFFVISGYLMTRIIVGRYDTGKLSVWNFYLDRGRRIIPALAFLCAALMAYGIWKLSPIGLMQLAKHITGSLLFISNGMYWLESGYFDASSHTKWLLHTWSLSVEWQFYLIYPFIIIGIVKSLGRQRLGLGLISACALSYALSFFTPAAHQSSAFYLIHTRAWEMIAGGLVCLYPLSFSARRAKLTEIAGFILVLASYFSMSERIAWPGYMALIPVAGACMILAANRHDSYLTNNRVSQFLGTTSYSIYLWHWPVVVFMLQNEIDGTWSAVAGIAASILFGWISYALVENRLRADKSKKAQQPFIRRHILSGAFGIVFVAGLVVYQTDGLPSRYDGKINELTKIKDVYSFFEIPAVWRNGICHSSPIGMSEQERINQCAEQGKHKVFLWGDSYAAALYPGLVALQKETKKSFSIEQFTDGNGSPFFTNLSLADNKKDLITTNEEKLQILSSIKPEKVVITWMVYGSNAIQDPAKAVVGLKDTVSRIRQASPSTEIIVIGPVPQWNENLVAVLLKYWDKFGTYPPKYMDFGLNKGVFDWDALLQKEMKADGVEYISALKELCNEQGCITRVGDDAHSLAAADWGHLTPAASRYFIERIKDKLLP